MATALPNGTIRVSMGPVTVADRLVVVTTADGTEFKALTADVGNPHAVSFVENPDDLPLYAPPRWDPTEEFPLGVNLSSYVREGSATSPCVFTNVESARPGPAAPAQWRLLPRLESVIRTRPRCQ